MLVLIFMRRDGPGRAGTAEAHGEKDVDVTEAAASAVAAGLFMGVPGAVLEVRCRPRPSPLPDLNTTLPSALSERHQGGTRGRPTQLPSLLRMRTLPGSRGL